MISVGGYGHEFSRAAPPSAIGALVKWLVTSPEGVNHTGATIEAQPFIREHKLFPEWSKG